MLSTSTTKTAGLAQNLAQADDVPRHERTASHRAMDMV
jgi:hypothetical protein